MRLLTEGQAIRDTYEVERFLGEGAFAEVYRVRHQFLGRQAMKVFKRVGMSKEEIHEMLGEAILLSRIGHPNIVRVFDANVLETPRGTCGYFTMEHVPGGSLDKFWRSHGGKLVPLLTTLDLIKQVCRGLAQAHRESPPIVHRDIKPQNILVGYEGDGLRARVSDFGLAKKVNPLTLLATAAGTMAFKAPEAFVTRQSDSCAGDVWSIGTTLYLLLTDQLPYEMPAQEAWEPNPAFDKPLAMPSTINPDVDRRLDEIVSRALAKKTEARYPNAGELLGALEQWKPGATEIVAKRKSGSSAGSKTILGPATPTDGVGAEALIQKAFNARQNGRLADAADIMEEAFNKMPDLRAKYSHQVRLWRCGVSM
jgi:eukaryotic-like serine/threonine-protein kinase